MARTLAISDDVYEMVSKVKMKGESFSDVIRSKLLKRQTISDIPKMIHKNVSLKERFFIKRSPMTPSNYYVLRLWEYPFLRVVISN